LRSFSGSFFFCWKYFLRTFFTSCLRRSFFLFFLDDIFLLLIYLLEARTRNHSSSTEKVVVVVVCRCVLREETIYAYYTDNILEVSEFFCVLFRHVNFQLFFLVIIKVTGIPCRFDFRDKWCFEFLLVNCDPIH